MKYDEAIAALNGAAADEIRQKLNALGKRETLSEEERNALISETAGLLFSVCKECKDEELYRIEKAAKCPKEREEELWEDDFAPFGGEHIVFTSNPITPFTEEALECGDRLLLLTYRKAVSENPKLVLLEGVPEGSTVLGILEKEGLSENGRQNYLSICDFIRSETAKENKDFALLSQIAELLEEESGASGFCFKSGEAEHLVFWKEEAKIYYRCTSSIVCSLVSIEGKGGETKVEIKPLAHNAGKIETNEPIEYEDFGEVGCFTFEMADYE